MGDEGEDFPWVRYLYRGKRKSNIQLQLLDPRNHSLVVLKLHVYAGEKIVTVLNVGVARRLFSDTGYQTKEKF